MFMNCSSLLHKWRLVSALVPYVGRAADPAVRIACRGFPARESEPDRDRKEGISFQSRTRVRRCLALAHLRLLDDRPATTTADTGIFRFIQCCPHDVGVVAGVFPIVADESEARVRLLPGLSVEVFADDSPHSFSIHFLDEFLAIALQSRGRDVGISFGVEAVTFQVFERTHFVGHHAEPDIARLRVNWFPCGSPKLCPFAFSTAWIIAIHRPTAIRAAHVLHHRGPNWNNAPGLPYSSEPSARKPCSSAATHCAQAQASQATDCCAR